ncbi:Elongation factor Ts, mitochondrial [Coemansia biformis]|uniref:Elongation factor Ts, mitochondrial n=1 Tax=Coemansia biformis TaxID=1286918 RepID=A0A9W7YE22_9FUNG|nr:Elongation factor Ts, mitochondrial [Coemansia biformis]
MATKQAVPLLAGALRPGGLVSGALGASCAGWRAYTTKVDIGALKRLRQLNPVALSKAKEALLASSNSIDRALEWLEKDALAAGAQKADKVKDRVACEGVIAVHVDEARTAASIVELSCETDFVARNAAFVDLATGIATAGAAFAGSGLGAGAGASLTSIEIGRLAAAALEGRTVADAVTESIGRLGENIVLRRAVTVGALGATGSIAVGGYVHGAVAGTRGGSAGKIGGLVALRGVARDAEHRGMLCQLAKRLAQQVVGYAPRYATHADWERAKAAGADVGDPEATVLEAQQFLFGGGTVAAVLAKLSTNLASPVEVASFVRFARGEGIEKPARPDFAEEVRRQLA